MNWIFTGIYLSAFAGLASAVCAVIASNPIMAPSLLLLLPMAAWAAVDIHFIWKS